MLDTTLVVGYGEVGRALALTLASVYVVHAVDVDQATTKFAGPYNVMHVCFPYSSEFVNAVKYYRELYQAQRVIIHSTVPVGTSRKCDAVHSPVMGVHPHLETGLKIFTKFVGGEQASEVADHLRRAGMRVYLFDKPETTELMKLLSTTFYAVCIEYVKDAKRACDRLGVPFEAWTIWTQAYNEGYKALGRPDLWRPNLVPIMRDLGGHCLLPNCKLLDTVFADFVRGMNE